MRNALIVPACVLLAFGPLLTAAAQEGGPPKSGSVQLQQEHKSLVTEHQRLTREGQDLKATQETLSKERERIAELRKRLAEEGGRLKTEETRLVQQIQANDQRGQQFNTRRRTLLEEKVAEVNSRKARLEAQQEAATKKFAEIEAAKSSVRTQADIDRLNARIRQFNAEMAALGNAMEQHNADTAKTEAELLAQDNELAQLERLQTDLQNALSAVRGKWQDHRLGAVQADRDQKNYDDQLADYNVKRIKLGDDWKDYRLRKESYDRKLGAGSDIARKPPRPYDDEELQKAREDARKADEERKKLESLLHERVKPQRPETRRDSGKSPR